MTTAADLEAFRRKAGWSNNRLCAELGITTMTLSNIRSGKSKVRRYIGLAMAAISAELEPFKRSDMRGRV